MTKNFENFLFAVKKYPTENFFSKYENFQAFSEKLSQKSKKVTKK